MLRRRQSFAVAAIRSNRFRRFRAGVGGFPCKLRGAYRRDSLSLKDAAGRFGMRPKERRDSGQNDLFRARLDQIVDTGHPLAKLAAAIDWRFLEERCGAVYSDGPGQPPLPTRLMAGLSILKHMHDLSDEVLREPVLPAVLRRGVLSAQARLRPFVADALAPANG